MGTLPSLGPDWLNSKLPPKPRHGQPCNGCGLCCGLELCPASRIAFPTAKAPCPALELRPDGKSTFCQLVETELKFNLKPILQQALGIGHGCSMDD